MFTKRVKVQESESKKESATKLPQKINWKSYALEFIKKKKKKKIEKEDDLEEYGSQTLGKESFNKDETAIFSSKSMSASSFTNQISCSQILQQR